MAIPVTNHSSDTEAVVSSLLRICTLLEIHVPALFCQAVLELAVRSIGVKFRFEM